MNTPKSSITFANGYRSGACKIANLFLMGDNLNSAKHDYVLAKLNHVTAIHDYVSAELDYLLAKPNHVSGKPDHIRPKLDDVWLKPNHSAAILGLVSPFSNHVSARLDDSPAKHRDVSSGGDEDWPPFSVDFLPPAPNSRLQ